MKLKQDKGRQAEQKGDKKNRRETREANERQATQTGDMTSSRETREAQLLKGD